MLLLCNSYRCPKIRQDILAKFPPFLHLPKQWKRKHESYDVPDTDQGKSADLEFGMSAQVFPLTSRPDPYPKIPDKTQAAQALDHITLDGTLAHNRCCVTKIRFKGL